MTYFNTNTIHTHTHTYTYINIPTTIDLVNCCLIHRHLQELFPHLTVTGTNIILIRVYMSLI